MILLDAVMTDADHYRQAVQAWDDAYADRNGLPRADWTRVIVECLPGALLSVTDAVRAETSPEGLDTGSQPDRVET